jgi:hypothetical protein
VLQKAGPAQKQAGNNFIHDVKISTCKVSIVGMFSPQVLLRTDAKRTPLRNGQRRIGKQLTRRLEWRDGMTRLTGV